MTVTKYEKINEDLINAYKDLGVFDEEIKQKVDNHTKKIQTSFNLVSKQRQEKKGLNVDDVLPLVLLNRTTHIIQLSKDLENKKNEINSQLILYKKVVEDFFANKIIELEQIRDGVIRNKKDNKLIPIKQLSSGEKQLLIILTETLLQQKENCIFIADEPELSLHVLWQKNLIQSIQKINPNAQIIVATHSPEIASMWGNNIVDMENVFQEENNE